MNTANPLVPQGSLERQAKGKSTVRIAILTIVSIHAVFFAGLLMQGCRRDETPAVQMAELPTNQVNSLPLLDQNQYYPAPQDIPQQAAIPASAPPPVSSSIVTDFAAPLPLAVPSDLIDAKSYTIAKGDTLARIAKAHRITISALTAANPNVDPVRLRPGNQLQIPAPVSPVPSLGFKEPAPAESAAPSGAIHKVKPGENLTRIAKQHGTTVQALRSANNLRSDRLTVGQKLKLPANTSRTAGGARKTSALSKVDTDNLPM